MRRFVLVGSFALAACGGWQRQGSADRAAPGTGAIAQLTDLKTYYQRLGRFAAGAPIPFVGSIAFVAGGGDTAVAVVGLSLANGNLGFEREGSGFAARYRVDIAFRPENGPVVSGGQDEIVRVGSFQETVRSDESVLFQKTFRLRPGPHRVSVTLRDPSSGNVSTAEGDFTVPAFGPGSTTAPILAYQATGRGDLDRPVTVVLNPRGAVGYGGDTLLAYVEGYDFPGPTRVPFRVVTEADSVVYVDSLAFQGGREVESQVIRLRPDSMALGELRVVVAEGSSQRSTSALVSLSQAWIVTNFEEMLGLLRFFGEDERISALRRSQPNERARLWREFWQATDPDRGTPDNEALNVYFARVAVANQRFRDEGIPGWRTARGEVFITLGEPDEIYDASAQAQSRLIRWTYIDERLTLLFGDDTGFGTFRLLPSSRADYERVLARVRRRQRG